MSSIKLSYGSVNFSIPEHPLIDSFGWLTSYQFSPHGLNKFKVDNDVAVLVNRRMPSDLNGWHGLTNIQISIAKYLGGGENNQVEFNSYRRRDYQKRHKDIFTPLQDIICSKSGIDFDIFRSPSSRLHIALNLQCESRSDAAKLRDYFFETVNLRYLPVKRQKENTRYWNCPSYDGTGKPNQCFAVYPTGKGKLRLEYRRNNTKSVRSLVNSKCGELLSLENNFGSLSHPEMMNHIFWNTAIHFFKPEDRRKIVKSFRLCF